MAESELNTGKPFSVPGDVQYALIDFHDPWLQNAIHQKPAIVKERISRFLKDWREVKRVDSIVLYRRKAKL